mmetsp:Transcript_592/g.1134  ORF Transcript_592/g.1134 Transcript_592/m.1134 type:complete len:163 (-) Transcript_592:371-859(-)
MGEDSLKNAHFNFSFDEDAPQCLSNQQESEKLSFKAELAFDNKSRYNQRKGSRDFGCNNSNFSLHSKSENPHSVRQGPRLTPLQIQELCPKEHIGSLNATQHAANQRHLSEMHQVRSGPGLFNISVCENASVHSFHNRGEWRPSNLSSLGIETPTPPFFNCE